MMQFDNHDSRIRYIDLFFERDDLENIPDFPLPVGYRFAFYQPGDRDAWIAIEKSAKEFDSFDEGLKAWADYYGHAEDGLTQRMLFIENEQGEKVATATPAPSCTRKRSHQSRRHQPAETNARLRKSGGLWRWRE